jgi:hypothetical protein
LTWYIDFGLYFFGLFKLWISTLFVIPFKQGDMLWLLVPVWLAWFFSEFFQEKHGTSMGNAITNSMVVIWGSVDCTRQTVNLISTGVLVSLGEIILRFLVIATILAYGVIIVILGLKGNKIIKYIGRVREVTYAFAMFAPVLYNAVPLTLNHVIATVLFFPLFYFVIELIDRYAPNPKAVEEDEGDSKKDEFSSGSNSLGGDFGSSSDLNSGLNIDKGFGKGKDSGLDDFKL